MTEIEKIMNANTKRSVSTLATAWLCFALTSPGQADSSPEPPSTPSSSLRPATTQWLGALHRGFIPNVGQVPEPAAKFVLRDRGMSAYFTDRGFVLWTGQTTTSKQDGLEVKVPVAPRWELVGANHVEPLGGETFAHTVSFFRGNDPAKWHPNVPAYRDLRYPGILEGVELRVESREPGFEYSFHIEPHAKPDLRFRYDGITGLDKSLTGDLIVRTATGQFTESRPVAFQWIEGAKHAVFSSFEIVSASEYRIVVGAYDERHALVVDPVLDWSTSIGGSYNEHLTCLKFDPAGDVVVAGISWSVNLPITSGFSPFGTAAGQNFGNDPQWPEHTDIYIAKFSADGTQLRWAGYLGGAGATSEQIGRNKSLAIGPGGDVFITTHTLSQDFPVTAGSPVHQGQADVSITRIKGDGSAILWSRLMGASGQDYGFAVALQGTHLYVSGITTSPIFPVNSPLTFGSFAGTQDAFVAQLDAANGAVNWSSFLGGTQEERVAAIVADAAGVIVYGITDSADFHAAALAAQAAIHDSTLGGVNDAFLTKLGSGGNILWSTYLGGSQIEAPVFTPPDPFPLPYAYTDLALDSLGHIVAVGVTASSDFPNTTGRFQPALAGSSDAYVAKLTSDGSLLWASYLGGTRSDGGAEETASSVALNPWDEILIGGWTYWTSPSFPTTPDALKQVTQSETFLDGFLTKIDQNGTQILYSTLIGNNGWDDAILGLDYGFGKVLVGGWHLDTFFQITQGTFRQECNNCGSEFFLMNFLDAFVAHDGFESGNYSGGAGWAGNWTATGDLSLLTSSSPHSGTRHVRLRSNTGYLRRTVSVPPASTTLQLGFWAKVSSFESSDRADVLVSADAENWTPLRSFTAVHSNNQYRYYEDEIPAGLITGPLIHIAFDAVMNASNDQWYLDDIRITGTQGVVDQPPVIDIISPLDGAVVSGIVTITPNASDDVGVTSLTFFVDGNPLPGNTWDTTTASEGTHAIAATAMDTAGQTGTHSISVTVDNVNEPPDANAGLDLAAYVGDNVAFNGSASSDPDGTVGSYAWDFGDGGSSIAVNPTHAYLAAGSYTVTLTVTDNDGAVDSDTAVVTVSDPPSELEVFYDSFEVSEWDGKWTEDGQNDWFRSTQRATDGTRSAEVDGSANNASLTSIAINLQGRSNATITFDWLIESGLDSGEYLEFRVSTNGGSSWAQKAILRGNVEPENLWHNTAVELNGISQLMLQFRGKMNDSNEDANVDNVRVLAH